jgi:hypothetical protein
LESGAFLDEYLFKAFLEKESSVRGGKSYPALSRETFDSDSNCNF